MRNLSSIKIVLYEESVTATDFFILKLCFILPLSQFLHFQVVEFHFLFFTFV